MNVFPLRAGRLTGLVAERFDQAPIVDQLERLIAHCTSARAERISAGSGDHVVRCALVTTSGEIPVAVKVFGRQPWWKDRYDRMTVSKAERSFRAACFLVSKGIGTPEPIAWLERWEGSRLRESYYLCRYEPAPSFRVILSDILWNQRRHEALMDVLRHLAPAIRAMHDAGFMHGDMGNQNILLPRSESGAWLPPQMIDLNRCRIRPGPLGERERAHDLARIALPGAYVQVFKGIYSGNQAPPAKLDELEQTARLRFWRHRRFSRWRHPIRHWRYTRAPKSRPVYPPPRDLWLWDAASDQPVKALGGREERRQGHMSRSLYVRRRALRAWPELHRLHRKLLAESYVQPRALRGRIGIALHPNPEHVDEELELQARLGRPPVFVRFCHHETPADWSRTTALVERLAQGGTPVMIGVLQDRRAVLEPSSWAEFLNGVVRALVHRVTCVEVTHATDQAQWGVWSRHEYLKLLAPALELKREFPQLRLSGPACAGSDYRTVIAGLDSVPESFRFDALSHLVHLERGGPPERGRGPRSMLARCAMLRALARWSPRTADEVIVSEARWRPELLDGRFRSGETDVDDAGRMLRFLAVALCSGHVDRVYWSRLSAHEHGLVDDRDGFRPRPVFHALAFFLELLGGATFQRRHGADEDVHLLEFAEGSRRLLMAWCASGERELETRFRVERAWDAFGAPAPSRMISGSPRYYVLDQNRMP